jgi:hypothetical protein
MSTCAKRSVLNAGNRPMDVKRAALAVQSAANAFQQRQLPHTGSTGRPMGTMAAGRPLTHSRLGGSDPFSQLARAVDQLARATGDALAPPRGPVGWTGGRTPNAPGGGGSNLGGGVPGTFQRGEIVIGTHEAPYTEPLFVPLPPNFNPVAVIAARIIDTDNITRYFRTGVGCDFIPYGARAMIRSIDGMTIGDPTVLTYTFIFYGVMTNAA